MPGGQPKRDAVEFEWTKDDNDLRVPAEELYEVSNQLELPGVIRVMTCAV